MRNYQAGHIEPLSIFMKHLKAMNQGLMNCRNAISSQWTAAKQARIVSNLNAHICHDIGETDIRPSSSNAARSSDLFSVEAMLRRSF